MKDFIAVLMCCLLVGCHTTSCAEADDASDSWPLISIELRALLVDPSFLEEFGIDDIDLEANNAATFRSDPQIGFLPIEEQTGQVLITATLASQNSLSLTGPRVTMPPGEVRQVAMAYHIRFVSSDLEPDDGRPNGGFYAFDVACDLSNQSLEESRVQLVILGRDQPDGFHAENPLAWVESKRSDAPDHWIDLYPGRPFRLQALVADRALQLAYMPLSAFTGETEDERLLMLLVRATVLTSAEQEQQLFPGLDDMAN